ncbi:MAG: hypothetical protein R2698_07475 [Microthrixaceae bacterium]
MRAVSNNYQDPILFFHGDVYGWSLAEDRHDVENIRRLHREGARWFLATSARVVDRDGLPAYLSGRRQIGPGLASGCAIWDLRGG